MKFDILSKSKNKKSQKLAPLLLQTEEGQIPKQEALANLRKWDLSSPSSTDYQKQWGKSLEGVSRLRQAFAPRLETVSPLRDSQEPFPTEPWRIPKTWASGVPHILGSVKATIHTGLHRLHSHMLLKWKNRGPYNTSKMGKGILFQQEQKSLQLSKSELWASASLGPVHHST